MVYCIVLLYCIMRPHTDGRLDRYRICYRIYLCVYSKPDVRDVVYCYGFSQQTGEEASEDFDTILELYGLEAEERERGRLRDTITCSTDTAVLEE